MRRSQPALMCIGAGAGTQIFQEILIRSLNASAFSGFFAGEACIRAQGHHKKFFGPPAIARIRSTRANQLAMPATTPHAAAIRNGSA